MEGEGNKYGLKNMRGRRWGSQGVIGRKGCSEKGLRTNKAFPTGYSTIKQQIPDNRK